MAFLGIAFNTGGVQCFFLFFFFSFSVRVRSFTIKGGPRTHKADASTRQHSRPASLSNNVFMGHCCVITHGVTQPKQFTSESRRLTSESSRSTSEPRRLTSESRR